ncbi:hypothetical protein D0Y65_046080 [Glycine soja]|uniref:Uncharacterized protein n=1 Tax=Glycine soja TaxID=3848 RepID=A0A445G7U9_GLYSO|nr:hypothetical protein D0Y65_046080 [Glycine soja]
MSFPLPIKPLLPLFSFHPHFPFSSTIITMYGARAHHHHLLEDFRNPQLGLGQGPRGPILLHPAAIIEERLAAHII